MGERGARRRRSARLRGRLADERHFGRAAERLHVSQARVSQVINSSNATSATHCPTAPTAARPGSPRLGRQLRDDLRPGLRDSLERARLAARGITHVLPTTNSPGPREI